ncbi:MAG: single-stranded-DNA-specific exonuclease RecJ [Planctomycetes bacterium]|nr:single-stranded-DNA-specific exonuclease RecJ [Planctomycetota bacterium]
MAQTTQGDVLPKTWIVQPPWEGCGQAAKKWRVPQLVAQILFNRSVRSAEAAGSFLDPNLQDLHPPEMLHGAVDAARHLAAAARDNKRIILYGDYDVDGVTGVAILWHALKIAGADVSFYVPHRVEEGYGLNMEAIRSLADDGASMIVSVDCGITSVKECKLAEELGVSMIITDHHERKAQLPSASALVHPGLDDTYPNRNLCGAGVAFKVAWAFAREMTGSSKVSPEYREFLKHALSLAALGTIADVVPLVGENRIIARCGLARLSESPWPGVLALLDVSGFSAGDKIDGTDVGFKIGPRLNAAGRMGHARLAIELLTRADENRAREIAMYLDEHNRARQSRQRRHVKEACELVERAGMDGDTHRGIVLASDKWHPGIIGVVASRLVNRYHKPTVLIALENGEGGAGGKGGEGQGSARSVPHLAMNEAFEACSQHLISHGGHAMAAGLRIEAERVPAFTAAFVEYANNTLSGVAHHPKLQIDAEVPLQCLDDRTVTAIRNLGPFGEGHAKPLFATDWLELAQEPRCVGKNQEHLQVVLGSNGQVMKGIAFGAGELAEQLKEHRKCRVAFEPIINEFRGQRSVEMQIVDFKFPGDA